MQPEILLRHFKYSLFNELIHAARIRDVIAARIIFPGRIKGQHVSRCAGQQARDARHHLRASHLRDARHRGHRRGRHAEERNERAILDALILIRRIDERHACAHALEDGTQSLLARIEALIAEAGTLFQQQLGQVNIFLVRIHAHRIGMLRYPLAADVHADEMRREQDGGLTLQRIKMLSSFDTDQAGDVRPAGPPQQSPLNETTGEHFEVITQQLLAPDIVHVGETQTQIDVRHAPPFSGQDIQERAQGIADPYQHPKRQKVYQPQHQHTKSRQHGFPRP